MNLYRGIRNLAKSNSAQNLFLAAKEIHNIQLFENVFNFSALQEIYLNLLYFYENLTKDIVTENISRLVLENDLYADAYYLWKSTRKKDKKENIKSELYLKTSNKIKFLNKEDKK
jgi:hypothetical protein